MFPTRQNKWETQFLNWEELDMAVYPSAAYWTLAKDSRPCPAPGSWNSKKAKTLESRKLRQQATTALCCVLQTPKLEGATGNIKLGSLFFRSRFIKLMAYLRYGPHVEKKTREPGTSNNCANTLCPE